MKTASGKRHYFSEKWEMERICRWGCLALVVALGIILYLYWDPLDPMIL